MKVELHSCILGAFFLPVPRIYEASELLLYEILGAWGVRRVRGLWRKPLSADIMFKPNSTHLESMLQTKPET